MHQRWRSWMATLILALVLGTAHTYAKFPSVVMIYGGALREPIKVDVLAMEHPERLIFLGCGDRSAQRTLSTAEIRASENRQYLNIAMLWSRYDELRDPATKGEVLRSLRPEDAAQHGRLYLPSANDNRSFVVTNVHVMYPMMPHPVPTDDAAFTVGCWLTPEDIKTARALNIPGI